MRWKVDSKQVQNYQMSSITPASYSPGGCIRKQRRSGVILRKKRTTIWNLFLRVKQDLFHYQGAPVRLNGVAKYCRAQKQVVAFFLKRFNQEQTFVFSVPTQHAGVKMQEKPFVHPPTPTSSCSVCSAEEGYLTEKRLNICASCTTGNFLRLA